MNNINPVIKVPIAKRSIGSIKERLEKVKKVMNEKNIDALILTRDQKIMYLSSSYEDVANHGSALIVLKNSSPIFVATVSSGGRLPYESWIEDIRYWNPPYYGLTPVPFEEKVYEVLREKHLDKGVIGIETDYIPYRWAKTFTEKLPKAKFIDCEPLMNKIMAIHDGEEIALLRQACAITDVAYEAIMKNLQIGMSECQVAGIAEKAMRDAGAQYFYSPTQVNSHPEIACDPLPSNKIIQRNTVLRIDVHPSYKSYRSDCLRTFYLGKKPHDDLKKMAEVMAKGAEQMMEMLIPGTPVKEIAIKNRQLVEKAGYTHYPPHDLGHGIGTGHLLPLITAGSEEVIQEDMIVVANSHVTIQGKETVKMEFAVLVTEDKPELLQKSTPLEMVILNI